MQKRDRAASGTYKGGQTDWARPRAASLEQLLPTLFHSTTRNGSTFVFGALVVEWCGRGLRIATTDEHGLTQIGSRREGTRSRFSQRTLAAW
jgi:hypothetical protein